MRPRYFFVASPNHSALDRRLASLIGLVVGVAVLLSVWALSQPLHPEVGGIYGLAFWVAVGVLAAAAPVRMTGGTIVDVTSAPVIAAAALGGPAAAAVMAICTIEVREIRGIFRAGGIPWYGTLYNHASMAIPGVLSALVIGLFLPGGFVTTGESLVVVVIAGLIYVGTNNVLTALAIGTREARSFGSVLAGNVRQFGASLAGLAPVAWLMASMYLVVGAIGVLPFAVPLYATRVWIQESR